MRRTAFRVSVYAALAALAVHDPASAQTASPPIDLGPITQGAISPDVAAAYDTYRIQPIWFRGGAPRAEVSQLTAILKRAPFDGFADGPQLAAQIETLLAQVPANPSLAPSTDQLISSAWVRYLRRLKQPTPGMIYAYETLRPRPVRAEEVLLTAAAAPSLSDYLTSTSQLNPIYAQLRDSAWSEAQASGNLTPDPRLLVNLDRARSIPARGRFALVDAGNQRLSLFDNGEITDSMKVIVGTKELPTPLIASIIYYVTYNPYWHAPDHLVRKTIAPTVLRQGMRYLKSHGYHVLSDWTGTGTELDPTKVDWKGAANGTAHLLVQQDPGSLNSMGNLKFPFANSEDIYLHDTPNKALFAKNIRFLSNGCVRLEDARRFGRWLLGTDPVAPGKEPETPVQLPAGVPIVLTYLTAQIVDGKVAYVPDVYGWDTTGPPKFAGAT